MGSSGTEHQEPLQVVRISAELPRSRYEVLQLAYGHVIRTYGQFYEIQDEEDLKFTILSPPRKGRGGVLWVRRGVSSSVFVVQGTVSEDDNEAIRRDLQSLFAGLGSRKGVDIHHEALVETAQ